MAGRRRQSGAQRLELVMQALLQDLAVGDQPAPVTDRSEQGVNGVGAGWPAGALADQPDQRRTVTIVGLGATRPQLGSGRLGLGGCQQPHRPRPASFQLSHPGMVEPAGRLHPDQRRLGDPTGPDQPGQGVHPLA
jgi:hypothetical protein